MPDVVIGGDASGAVEACAAAQAAIDALHGKTVNVDINVREHGGGGIGAATRGMSDFGTAADRAGRATASMDDALGRSVGHAGGLGDNLGKAADHIGRMANEGQRLSNQLAAVDNILRGGAPSSTERSSSAMRGLADNADSARQAISGIGGESSRSLGAIEAGSGRASQGLREIGEGARASHEQIARLADAMQKSASTFSVASSGRIGGDAGAASRLGFGDQTGKASSNFAVDSAGNVSSRLSGASKAMDRFAGSAAGMGSAMGSSGREMERFGDRAGGASRELARLHGTAGGSAPFGDNSLLNGMLGGLGAMEGLAGKTGSAISQMAGFGLAGASIKGVGIAAGVSAIGMGALGAAVAGVGIAGVAGDFAANSQLMNKGQDAVRGFTKEFGKMRSETSASGMPAVDGLSTSLKGVGHELARIGADNMGSTLQHASELAGSTSTALKQLAPAVGPAEQALTSLGGAVVGALGQSAPAIASFADAVTQNSAGIQSGLVSTVSLMSNLGVMTAQALGTAAPLIQGASDVAGFAADFVSGGVRQQSNRMGDPDATGAGVDTGIPDGLGGTIKSPGASIGNKIGGALGAGAAGAGLGAAIGFAAAGPPGALLAGTVMGVGSAIAGWNHAGDPETALGPQAQTSSGFGPPQSQKSMGLSSGRPGLGNFGPGSGGPLTPPLSQVGSPDASQYAGMTGAQIYDQQYTQATGAPSGAPHYSGVGPRGPGQSVGPMPASTASGLGGGGGIGGGTPVLNDMMQAAQAQVAGGGGATGAAMVKHISKAVDVAAPAAASGGASLGAGMNMGMAQGSTSTQSVVDTVMIKHSKHIIEIAAGGLGIHSPSTEFDYLGRMTGVGFAQGIEGEHRRAAAATTGLFGQAKSGYDYQDGGPPSISFNPRNPAMTQPGQDEDPAQHVADWRKAQGTRQGQFQPGSNAWWAAHDNRAAELAAGRAQRRQIAQANIGAVDPNTGQRVVDPRRAAAGATVNPFQAGPAGLDPVRREAFSRLNPLSQLSAMFSQHGEAMTQGVGAGIKKGTPGAQNQMSQFSRGMQNQHKKDHGIRSPSTVFASDGVNMAAGVGVGFAAGAPGVASQISAATGTMSAGLQGPMSDYGLQVGMTYAQAFSDGSSRQIKKANYSALGLPSNVSADAMSRLAATGLLRAGSGASTTKTPSGGSATVTLPPPSIVLQFPEQHIQIGDAVVATIAQREIEAAFDAATNTYKTL